MMLVTNITSVSSLSWQAYSYAWWHKKCCSPKSLLPANAARIGEAGWDVEKHNDGIAKADHEQTFAHSGQDETLAAQVLASVSVADEQVSVEDDPHRKQSVPTDQALLGETEDILAKMFETRYSSITFLLC